MPEAGEAPALGRLIKKRWRAWLRALHRDVGYLAVGFTVIYALSGIAMNHIDDWDPNFHTREVTRPIEAIPDSVPDTEAARRVAAAAGMTEAVTDTYRAGDEVRLTFASGRKITAIGALLTIQDRRDRWFFRAADWLHATRGKQAWKYIADAYALLLLYLAISGVFMIKGKLGLRWRGALLIGAGLCGPVGYLVLSGGPGAQSTERVATRPGEVEPPSTAGSAATAGPGAAGSAVPAANPAGSNDGVRLLKPDDDE